MEEQGDGYKEAHKIIEEENQSAKPGPKNQQFEDNKMEHEANIGGQAGTESTGTEVEEIILTTVLNPTISLQQEEMEEQGDGYKEAHKIIEEENQSAKPGPKNQQFEDNKMEHEANIGGQARTESTGTEVEEIILTTVLNPTISLQQEEMEEQGDGYKEAHKIIEEENQSAKPGPKNQQFEDNKMEHEANIGGQAGTESTGTEDTKSNIKGVANQNTNESRPNFHCDVCGRWFIYQGRYLEHRRRHKGVYFVCKECNLQFQNKVSLNKHQLKTGHSGTHVTEGLEDAEMVENTSSQISVECHHCKKTLKNAHNLKVHLKTIHGHKPYTCEKCGKLFAFKCRLTEHMKYHNDGKSGFPCEFCGRTFKIKTSLYYHKDVTHVVGRTFECKICGENFKHKKLLLRHQAVHSTNRTFICQYCPLQFKTKDNVVRHERSHKNEINFLCHICGRLFTRQCNLVTHFRTHRSHERFRAREKNFLCHICGKLFSHKSTIRVHFKLH